MLSRNGVILIIGGSLIILLGSLANVIISWNVGIHYFSFISVCPGSGCIDAQRLADLDTLGNHLSATFSLTNGSQVPLALAMLGSGLFSLLRTRHSLARGWYRWLAILGLACLALSVLQIVLQLLIAQDEVRIGVPPGMENLILTGWLFRPSPWANLSGFLIIFWGSFLVQKPAEVHTETPPSMAAN